MDVTNSSKVNIDTKITSEKASSINSAPKNVVILTEIKNSVLVLTVLTYLLVKKFVIVLLARISKNKFERI
jgi:hypothetical protein